MISGGEYGDAHQDAIEGAERVKRQRLWLIACGATVAVTLLAACSGSGEDSGADATPSAKASRGRTAAAVSDRAVKADQVKSAVEARISPYEERFGSGVNSPCSTATSTMFTQACAVAAKETNTDAAYALKQIQGQQGFATLRSAAQKIQTAAATYQQWGCGTSPTKAATRHACLKPAAVLAQGFSDLRDGVNLGLAGK
ncbi:hypothetical protein [Streptomyces sp. NPDC054783]